MLFDGLGFAFAAAYQVDGVELPIELRRSLPRGFLSSCGLQVWRCTEAVKCQVDCSGTPHCTAHTVWLNIRSGAITVTAVTSAAQADLQSPPGERNDASKKAAGVGYEHIIT